MTLGSDHRKLLIHHQRILISKSSCVSKFQYLLSKSESTSQISFCFKHSPRHTFSQPVFFHLLICNHKHSYNFLTCFRIIRYFFDGEERRHQNNSGQRTPFFTCRLLFSPMPTVMTSMADFRERYYHLGSNI